MKFVGLPMLPCSPMVATVGLQIDKPPIAHSYTFSSRRSNVPVQMLKKQFFP
jgi:hypothetical protein